MFITFLDSSFSFSSYSFSLLWGGFFCSSIRLFLFHQWKVSFSLKKDLGVVMVVNNPRFRRLGCFNPWLVRLIIVSPLLPWVPSVRWSIGKCWMSQVWFLSFSFFALGLGGEILAIGILDLWKVFLVALFFNAYLTFSRRGGGGGSIFPSVWKVKIFEKVKFFIWQVLHGRVDTLDQILGGRSLVVGLLCYIMCKRTTKDVEHITWSFNFARVV